LSYEGNENSENKIKRRIKQKQLERTVRKGQIGLNRFRVFLRIASIILLIMLGYKVLKFHGWYLNKSVFNTPENNYLKIYNNKITPDYKILGALRQVSIPNHPLYMINPKIFEDSIKNLEPVKNVFVKRYFHPARLYVYVEEREPIFVISPDEDAPAIAFFTNDGQLIGREYMPLPQNYKTYTILTYGNRGDDYHQWTKEKILKLYALAKMIEKETNQKLLYMDMRNPNDIYVQIESVKVRIGELNNTLAERVKRISKIDEMMENIDKPIKYIDLSWDDTTYIKHD